MSSRPKQPQPRPTPRLYLVTPQLAEAEPFVADLSAALGTTDVAAVLLRLAEADERALINRIKQIAPLAQERGAALLLDGYPDLVARGGADGSHLKGLDAFSRAVEQLKPDRIAGTGDLETRHDAMIAAEIGADYIMFGNATASIEETCERVTWCAEVFELPCVAFAPSIEQIPALVAAGADFVAVDCVWADPRGASAAVTDAVSFLRLPETAS